MDPKLPAACPTPRQRGVGAQRNFTANLHRFRWLFIAGCLVTVALPILALAYFGATGRTLPRPVTPVGFVAYQVLGWLSLAAILISSFHPGCGVLARAIQPAPSVVVAAWRLVMAVGALAFMLALAGLLIVIARITFGT